MKKTKYSSVDARLLGFVLATILMVFLSLFFFLLVEKTGKFRNVELACLVLAVASAGLCFAFFWLCGFGKVCALFVSILVLSAMFLGVIMYTNQHSQIHSRNLEQTKGLIVDLNRYNMGLFYVVKYDVNGSVRYTSARSDYLPDEVRDSADVYFSAEFPLYDRAIVIPLDQKP